MSWFFYSKEGRLQYDLVAGALGNADKLDGIDSLGFVQQATPPAVNAKGVQLQGSFYLPITTTSASIILDYLGPNFAYEYRTIIVDTTTGNKTVTLPDPPNSGQVYEIKNSGVNTVTINGLTTPFDGGGTTASLTTLNEAVTIVSTGTEWRKVSSFATVGGAIYAATLDSLDSLQFLRSDVPDTAAGNITFSKSMYHPINTVTDQILDDTYRTVLVDTSAAFRTITLPLGPAIGQRYEIKDKLGTAGTNKIVVNPNGQTIDGSGVNLELTTDDDVLDIVYSGSEWFIISHRFGGSLTANLDDLGDVTITLPVDGQLLRYDTPTNEWSNTGSATLDDNGRLHVPSSGVSGGISLGDAAGVGNEAVITWSANKTTKITGRTVTYGTPNGKVTQLENGVVPVGDTYSVSTPTDNKLFCVMNTGDLFIRLPQNGNPTPPLVGDSIIVKDVDGQAISNTLALVGEGVRHRNVPILTPTTPVGPVVNLTTTTTPGGPTTDEVQNFQVSGGTSFKVTFDGQEAATVLLVASATGLALVTAINSLSPHPNYGYFTVTTTTPAALVTAGVPVTFDGGSLIDGDAFYYLGAPYQSAEATYSSGNWYLT